MALPLAAIVAELGGDCQGDPALLIEGLAPLESAGPAHISFLSNPRYRQQLEGSRAGCVIVGEAMREAALARGACIVADDPYLYFARLTRLWRRVHARPSGPPVHPSAVIDPEATLGEGVRVGPLCVVERGARIGAGTVLKARVHVGEDCVLGQRCIVHPGVVIGADGFGFAPHAGTWEKIEQLGAVRIGDDVEIGANTCIDRGALADTVIEEGVKLDNLIQIGHNCRIGRHTAIAGCVGIAGSATIGAHCTIGGAAMILGHLTLADGVNISAGSFVARSILKPGLYTGIFPIDDNASWEKNAATLRQLHQLRERIKALEKR
ncbi:UDP-3-O-(3-hydroxymyristoyl)glucosamine N-acyltransferase [Ramlibacter sp.]|uniref:UDP-3-O-(3-hydroxymyristoyl)glucosamine N-acyltransferase n=1 Tax=Ramlibacter sp. TaxID=1917967 RepID=UPI0035B2250B